MGIKKKNQHYQRPIALWGFIGAAPVANSPTFPPKLKVMPVSRQKLSKKGSPQDGFENIFEYESPVNLYCVPHPGTDCWALSGQLRSPEAFSFCRVGIPEQSL